LDNSSPIGLPDPVVAEIVIVMGSINENNIIPITPLMIRGVLL